MLNVQRFDFPTYHFALNAIGTLWDAKFYPQLAETRNSWESGAEIARAVDGTHWTCELRIPLAAVTTQPPTEDTEVKLSEPRTLEFALQAGPLKPLPAGWRGLQDRGNPQDAPLTIVQIGGSGKTLAGGTHIIHPGTTPDQLQRSREGIEKALEGGTKAVVGYHFWGMVPKGLPETRVFRGEWGIDKQTWETTTSARQWEWKNRFYGDNKDLYVMMRVSLVPSYVDFLTYAYDEALKHTRLSGFYDDTGYPKPVYDEELGLGFVREDGRRVYSSGLWTYRERWKRAAYVNFVHGRPNYLRDSQHCHAHFAAL
jgi:hypothetical protein